MFLLTFFTVFKIITFILSIVVVIGLFICVIIGIGALIAALFTVFPTVSIVLAVIVAAIVISAAAYCINSFIKERKRKKLYKTAKENREKHLKEIADSIYKQSE